MTATLVLPETTASPAIARVRRLYNVTTTTGVPQTVVIRRKAACLPTTRCRALTAMPVQMTMYVRQANVFPVRQWCVMTTTPVPMTVVRLLPVVFMPTTRWLVMMATPVPKATNVSPVNAHRGQSSIATTTTPVQPIVVIRPRAAFM